MRDLNRRIRRHSERVEFCDRCSRVVTSADRSRKLAEVTRTQALAGMTGGRR